MRAALYFKDPCYIGSTGSGSGCTNLLIIQLWNALHGTKTTFIIQEVHSECDTDQSDGKKDDDLEKDDDYVPTGTWI